MRRETKMAVIEPQPVGKSPPKFELGKNYTAPNSVVESGVVRFVCHEWGADNKHLGGQVWCYSAIAMPQEVHNLPSMQPPAFSRPFLVTEEELLKTWKSQPFKWDQPQA
jgi:hypothetical protein